MATSSGCYVGRFAPSPTGELHFGSMLVAVGSWLCARASSGEWLLRMEDVDRSRTRPGAAARIVDVLCAHGLVSDRPVLTQAADTSRYGAALDALVAAGHAYACPCTRADVRAAGGIHRACVAGAEASRDHPTTWRVRVPPGKVSFTDCIRGAQAQDVARRVGDFVLKRSNGEYTYHLAVVVDDWAQGVSEVVRGADLLASTARQVVLQRLLGLATPRYLHLPLIVDEAGAKLSKQAQSAPVDPTRPMPTLRTILAMLGQACDFEARDPGNLLSAAASRFSLAAMPRANCMELPQY